MYVNSNTHLKFFAAGSVALLGDNQIRSSLHTITPLDQSALGGMSETLCTSKLLQN